MKTPNLIAATQAELDEILALARAAFPPRQYQLLEAILGTFAYVMAALQNARTSIKRFRQMLFGTRTESRANVLGVAVIDVNDGVGGAESELIDASAMSDALMVTQSHSSRPVSGAASDDSPVKPKRRGHGRNGAQAYSGAAIVEVALTVPAAGQVCPQCEIGRVYAWPPRTIVKVTGQSPIGGTVYKLQQRRCRACDALFTAPMPEGVTVGPKHDERCVCMLILLRYGYGMPSYRLQALQASLGTPMPDATQWDLVRAAWPGPRAAYKELIRQAAQAELLHNDDTPARILSLMVERRKLEASGQEPEARAINTSGIVAVLRTSGREIKVALFFTGHAHAGDNLGAVLAKRAETLGAPMHMCDGLAANIPGELATVLSNCLAHGRRKFVELVDHFPFECRHVIEVLARVYTHDEHCREQAMSPQQRLVYHQAHSGPPMRGLQTWMNAQIEERRVEPNSSLGAALNYMLKRWDALTLFLRQAGAALDNNVCERALKRAIRHRKASLFYKTQNGAEVGDTFMSLIHTCELCGVNPFEYLQALLRHTQDVLAKPALWLPWNYHERLAQPLTLAA
jgi:transposase